MSGVDAAAQTITVLYDATGAISGTYDNAQSVADAVNQQASGVEIASNSGQLVAAISAINPVDFYCGEYARNIHHVPKDVE